MRPKLGSWMLLGICMLLWTAGCSKPKLLPHSGLDTGPELSIDKVALGMDKPTAARMLGIQVPPLTVWYQKDSIVYIDGETQLVKAITGRALMKESATILQAGDPDKKAADVLSVYGKPAVQTHKRKDKKGKDVVTVVSSYMVRNGYLEVASSKGKIVEMALDSSPMK